MALNAKKSCHEKQHGNNKVEECENKLKYWRGKKRKKQMLERRENQPKSRFSQRFEAGKSTEFQFKSYKSYKKWAYTMRFFVLLMQDKRDQT